MSRLVLLVALSWAAAAAGEGLEAARALLEAAQRRGGDSGFAYRAQHMYYYEEGDSIVLRGRATVLHEEAVLEAAEMVYYRAQERVEARAARDSSGRLVGQPTLRRGDEVLRGEAIVYDLASGRGRIRAGRIHRDKGYYAGRLIQTRSEREFRVREGSYTTCDLPAPHFDFYSPRIKVLVDDLAIARPVYFRVARHRILWIPFYVFSLGEKRRSGLLTPTYGRRPLRFGSAASEWEVRNLGYYIAPNDYWDAAVSADLRQRSGWLGRLQLNYALRYHFEGRLDARVENRQSGTSAQRNWRLELSHNQELGAEARLRASGTLQSNASFSRDNGADLGERLNRTLRSNLSYSRRFRPSGNSLSLNASQTRNLDAGTSETTWPEISLRKARKPLWGAAPQGGEVPWYGRIFYDASARLRNSRRRAERSTAATSAELNLRFSAQYRPFAWLSIDPTLDESWRDADLRTGRQPGERRDRFSARVGLTQTWYGLFRPHWGPLVALRHVLKPALHLNYQAARQRRGGLLGAGSGGWRQTRRLELRLDNTFWAKVQRGEDESKVRFLQANFSTVYDLEREERPLADLVSSLNLAAGRYISSRLSLRSAWYDEAGRFGLQAPRQFEVRTALAWSGARQRAEGDSSAVRAEASRPAARGAAAFGFERGLSSDIGPRTRQPRLQLSHYYARTRNGQTSTSRSWLRLGAGLGLGAHWSVDYSLNYDLRAPGLAPIAAARVTAELLSLRRRFHDWTATLNIAPTRFRRERAFYFKAQFNDIPQIKFERGEARF